MSRPRPAFDSERPHLTWTDDDLLEDDTWIAAVPSGWAGPPAAPDEPLGPVEFSTPLETEIPPISEAEGPPIAYFDAPLDPEPPLLIEDEPASVPGPGAAGGSLLP